MWWLQWFLWFVVVVVADLVVAVVAVVLVVLVVVVCCGCGGCGGCGLDVVLRTVSGHLSARMQRIASNAAVSINHPEKRMATWWPHTDA